MGAGKVRNCVSCALAFTKNLDFITNTSGTDNIEAKPLQMKLRKWQPLCPLQVEDLFTCQVWLMHKYDKGDINYMPIYKYRCIDCGEQGQRVAGLDDHTALCIQCGSLMLRLDKDIFKPYFEEVSPRPLSGKASL